MIGIVTSTDRKLGKDNLILKDVYKKEIRVLGMRVHTLERKLETNIEDEDNKEISKIGFTN